MARHSHGVYTAARQRLCVGLAAIGLLTAFNFFSHGTQDLYPTFLQVQHGFGPHEVGLIGVSNICAWRVAEASETRRLKLAM